MHRYSPASECQINHPILQAGKRSELTLTETQQKASSLLGLASSCVRHLHLALENMI